MNAEGAYIEEIILVDDSSTMENLGEKLEIALSYFKKPIVKLIRNFERMGLIQRFGGSREFFPQRTDQTVRFKPVRRWRLEFALANKRVVSI